jgi:hypothetical protein
VYRVSVRNPDCVAAPMSLPALLPVAFNESDWTPGVIGVEAAGVLPLPQPKRTRTASRQADRPRGQPFDEAHRCPAARTRPRRPGCGSCERFGRRRRVAQEQLPQMTLSAQGSSVSVACAAGDIGGGGHRMSTWKRTEPLHSEAHRAPSRLQFRMTVIGGVGSSVTVFIRNR